MHAQETFKKMSLFAGLSDQELDQVAAIAESKTYPAGTQIYQEGDVDASLFIVQTGLVKIDKRVNFDQQQTLEQLRPGVFFGEISFVLGGAHIATAEALEPSEILQIRRSEFDKLARSNQALAYRIMVRMAMQLANLLKEMDEKFIELVSYIWGRSKK